MRKIIIKWMLLITVPYLFVSCKDDKGPTFNDRLVIVTPEAQIATFEIDEDMEYIFSVSHAESYDRNAVTVNQGEWIECSLDDNNKGVIKAEVLENKSAANRRVSIRLRTYLQTKETVLDILQLGRSDL